MLLIPADDVVGQSLGGAVNKLRVSPRRVPFLHLCETVRDRPLLLRVLARE